MYLTGMIDYAYIYIYISKILHIWWSIYGETKWLIYYSKNVQTAPEEGRNFK